MGRVTTPLEEHDIEFIVGVVEPESATGEAPSTPRSPLRWVGLAVLFVLGGWLISSVGADELPTTEDQAAEEEPVAENSASVRGETQARVWPDPVADRDPFVVRIPGPADRPDEFVVSALERTTIVYANTVGDPTVVSFDTGDVFAVDVAAIRVHERFAVEAGRVVSLEGVNPGLGPSTEDAIVFHTFRDVDPPGVGTAGDLQGIGRGPEICLSDTSCGRPGLGLERVVRGDLVAERYEPIPHWAIAEVFDNWERVDRWLVSSEGYRIPAPVGSTMWVIGPPSGGSSSSSGLL